MNKTVSLRDDVLAAIDSIDNVVTESEIDVLVSMLGATDKAVSIMENYSGDELGSFGIFMEDGENSDKKESVLKSIATLPIRLLKAIWKLLTGQFNEKEIQAAKAAGEKAEKINIPIFSGIVDFFTKDDGSADKVKIAGTLVAVAGLTAFRAEFKEAANNARTAISNTANTITNRIRGNTSSTPGDLQANTTFVIAVENNRRVVKTNISLDACRKFISHADEFILHPPINDTAAKAKQKVDELLNTANQIIVGEPQSYEYETFVSKVSEIQQITVNAGIDDRTIGLLQETISTSSNNEKEAILREYSRIADVFRSTLQLLADIIVDYHRMNTIIVQTVQQVEQTQPQVADTPDNGNPPTDPNNPNPPADANNPPTQQTLSGEPLYVIRNRKFSLNDGGSTTNRQDVLDLLEQVQPGEYHPSNEPGDNINIINNSDDEVTEFRVSDFPGNWAAIVDHDCANFVISLDGNRWIAKDLGTITDPNDPMSRKKSFYTSEDVVNQNIVSMNRSKIEGGLRLGGRYGELLSGSGKSITEFTDREGYHYLWDNSKHGYRLDKSVKPTATPTYAFNKNPKTAYTADAIIYKLEAEYLKKPSQLGVISANDSSLKPALKKQINGIKGLASNSRLLVHNGNIIVTPFDLNTTKITPTDIDTKLRPRSKGVLTPGLDKNGQMVYVYEYADDDINDSDELVQEEFEVDPVTSTWYSK